MNDNAKPSRSRPATELIIVSGLSGSGKTTGLRTLEDLGYYCIDNLPITLLPALGEQLRAELPNLNKAAVGIDIRNSSRLEQFGELIDQLKASDVDCRIVFFTASRSTLLNRFNETRRKHPLADPAISTGEAISRERQLLLPISERADLTLDTSNHTIYDLRDRILALIGDQPLSTSIVIQSFGFKYGAPGDLDMIFDMRCLPNPNWHDQLRPHTGLDQPVIEFLNNEPLVQQLYNSTREFLEQWIPHYFAGGRSYLNIGIGCTGGRHRSVFIAQKLTESLSEKFNQVTIKHRELPDI